jgi:hypothetical protein
MSQNNSHRPIPSATSGAVDPRFEAMWPTDYLEPFMMRADPLADRIMDLLYAEGRADAAKAAAQGQTDPPPATYRPRRVLQFLTYLINQMAIPDPELEHPFPGSDYTLSPEVREALRTYLREGQKLPPWADMDLITEAQQLFSDNPIVAYVLLAAISLPVLYTCGRGGIQVLALTQQLVDKVRRRVIETGTLIINAMQKDAFTKLPDEGTSDMKNPLPIGVEGILRVRMLHAATRTVIYEFWQDGVRDRAKDPSSVRKYQGVAADKMWSADWGKPIHQQYMAGTLMTFSYITIYGLAQLGVDTNDRQKKAYMHYWNVFGYITGIEEEMLLKLDFPLTQKAVYENGKPVHAASGEEMYQAGKVLYTQMMELNRSRDAASIAAGRALTKGVIDYCTDVLTRRLAIGKVFNMSYVPRILMTTMLSDDDRELLGVKSTLFEKLTIPLWLAAFWIRGLFAKAAGKPANLIANLLLKLMQQDIAEVYVELQKKGGVRYPGIPMEFQQKWGLVKN